MEREALSGYRAFRVSLDLLAMPESREKKVSPVKRDPEELEDQLVHPVSRVNVVGREEMEKEEPQVHPGRKVNPEPKVCLVYRVTRENEDTKDLRVSR